MIFPRTWTGARSAPLAALLTCAALGASLIGLADASAQGQAEPPARVAPAPRAAEPAMPPVVKARLDALRQDLLAFDDWRALAAAIQLEDLLRLLDADTTHQLVDHLTGDLPAASEPQRLAAARLQLLDAARLLDAGRQPEADAQLRRLGFVLDWSIVGPFENRSMAAFDVNYTPEGPADPDATFEGKNATSLTWRPYAAAARGGVIDLAAVVNPSRSALAYAATTVESKAPQRVALRVGAQGAYKLWVNGRLAARADSDAGSSADADTWLVDLDKGPNTLLLKLAGDNRGPLSFTLRVTTPDAAPLPLPATAALKRGAVLAGAAPLKGKGVLRAPSPDARAAEVARSAAGPRGDLLTAAALIAHALHPLDPATPWRDLAREAARVEPDNLNVLLNGASTLPEHWQRLAWLERASAAHPADPWLRARAAEELAGGLGLARVPERLALIDALLKEQDAPGRPALLPRLLKAQLLLEQGQPRAAERALKNALPAAPHSPTLLGLLLTTWQRLGDDRSALEAGRAYLKLHPADLAVAERVAQLELTAAQPQRALDLLDAALKLRPEAVALRCLQARAQAQLGDPRRALRTLEDALAISPLHPELLREKSEHLERIGDPEAAAATLELALEIQPERADLEERLRALRPEADSFEAPWRWSLDDLQPAPDAEARWAGHDFAYLGSQKVILVAPSGQSSRFTQTVVQILTPEGAKTWRAERVYYSPGYERVDVVSVRVRKRSGAIVEVHRRNDYDASQGSGTIYYQRRFAYLDVGNLEPGDVVEYAWREHDVAAENFREGYFGDLWTFEASVPVERARYVLLTPQDMTVHVRPPQLSTLRAEQGTQHLRGADLTSRSLEATALPAVRTEASMPGRAEIFDYVLVSTYKTWDEVGRWWWNLIKEQLVIDDEIRRVAREVTRGVKTDRDKVRAIHNWVVKNTRYVGIEFGVHGWKPYRTTLCMQRRFGDCKDKASLIKVMLEAAGIECNLVLIRTNQLGQVADEPANLAIFNHAIAYVPGFDLFLDGTAEFSGTEELPWSDQGTFAIIVKDGGEVRTVTTPVDPPEHNRHLRVLEVDLSGGSSTVKAELVATGVDAVWYRRTFDTPEQARRDQALEGIVARLFPGARLLEARYTQIADLEAPVRVQFTFQGGGFIKQVGDAQALFPAGREIRLLDQYAAQATRDQDLILGVPYTSNNTVRYKLPPDLTPRRLPEPRADKGPFGAYSLQVRQTGDTLELEVNYALAAPRVSVKDYPAFRAWLNALDRALNQPIVLQRD